MGLNRAKITFIYTTFQLSYISCGPVRICGICTYLIMCSNCERIVCFSQRFLNQPKLELLVPMDCGNPHPHWSYEPADNQRNVAGGRGCLNAKRCIFARFSHRVRFGIELSSSISQPYKIFAVICFGYRISLHLTSLHPSQSTVRIYLIGLYSCTNSLLFNGSSKVVFRFK